MGSSQPVNPNDPPMLDDRWNKTAYSNPEPVASLLEEFVSEMLPGGGEWVDRLDFSSLERLATEHVSPAFRARSSDMLWRLKVRRPDNSAEWLYVLLLLEFQSTVDWFMALRVQEYAIDVYRSPELAGGKATAGARLPPLLAVVLYKGKRRWNAPLALAGLVAAEAKPTASEDGEQGETPVETRRLFHGERYDLIDIQRYDIEALSGGGLASQLLRWELVENRSQAVSVIVAVTKLLPEDRSSGLKAAFLEMVRLTEPRLGFELSDLVEDEKMITRLRAERLNSTLEERIQECDRKLREEGRAEGIQQRIERERELLCCMIGLKFDQDTKQRACRLLASVSDLDVLRKIQSWVLECRSAADLLTRMEGSVSVLTG